MIISRRIKSILSKKYKHSSIYVPQRNIQVTIIGAKSEIGSNLALLMKRNSKVKKLHLYDDDEGVRGIGMELEHIVGGPTISAYGGELNLRAAINSSDLVVLVSRIPRSFGYRRDQMVCVNAPIVQRICKAIVDQNPGVFFAISSNPINSLIPFASALMYKYNCYKPLKIFGITHIDTARSKAFAANALQVNASELQIPVIGGHSEETILPLFSNLTPTDYCVDRCQADTLTRLVRKAGTEVINYKLGVESATLAMAWSINEFIDGLVDAISGNEVIVNAYTANLHFGTRYFAGPTRVGPYGITQTCCNLPMNEYECYLLNNCVPIINEEIAQGEEYTQVLE